MAGRGFSSFLRRDDLEFLLKFIAFFFVLLFFLKFLDSSIITKSVAYAEYYLVNLFGTPATISANTITLPNSRVEIVPECSGFVMIILLAALLWSTNIENKRRARYLLIFGPFLFAFNILRLLITILVLNNHPTFFDSVHVFLWFVDSAIVMAIWMHAQGFRLGRLLAVGK